jgi:hypothetical protein
MAGLYIKAIGPPLTLKRVVNRSTGNTVTISEEKRHRQPGLSWASEAENTKIRMGNLHCLMDPIMKLL